MTATVRVIGKTPRQAATEVWSQEHGLTRSRRSASLAGLLPPEDHDRLFTDAHAKHRVLVATSLWERDGEPVVLVAEPTASVLRSGRTGRYLERLIRVFGVEVRTFTDEHGQGRVEIWRT